MFCIFKQKKYTLFGKLEKKVRIHISSTEGTNKVNLVYRFSTSDCLIKKHFEYACKDTGGLQMLRAIGLNLSVVNAWFLDSFYVPGSISALVIFSPMFIEDMRHPISS